MIPSQKFGTDTPPSERPLISTSQAVLRRTAASTPAGIAMASAMRIDSTVSSMVIGSFCADRGGDGLPRADRDAEIAPQRVATQRKYCTASGP